MKFNKHKIAWQFHTNTCRWRHNTLSETNTLNEIAPYKEYPNLPSFELPVPHSLNVTLKDAILNRHSCRNYADKSISLQDLSTVLHYGYGITNTILLDKSEFLERPVPSGGGLYSLEIYLLIRNVEGLEEGVYHFCINPACLEQISVIKMPDYYISQLFMNQYYLANSNCILMITSMVERNMFKYEDRGYRYILMEAGHLVQNMNLVAQSLGLGSLNMGGFFDSEVSKLLKIDMEVEVPIYAMALGNPSEDKTKNEIRLPDGLNY